VAETALATLPLESPAESELSPFVLGVGMAMTTAETPSTSVLFPVRAFSNPGAFPSALKSLRSSKPSTPTAADRGRKVRPLRDLMDDVSW
jgi:hypothetical protein